MKFLKVSFLAVVALIAMSFTFVSNKDFRETVSQCYQTVSLQYDDANCPVPNWLTLPTDCAAAQVALGRYLKGGSAFIASNFVPGSSPIECTGGPKICCVRFTATTEPPCEELEDEKTGDVSGGIVIGGSKYIKIINIYCKP